MLRQHNMTCRSTTDIRVGSGKPQALATVRVVRLAQRIEKVGTANTERGRGKYHRCRSCRSYALCRGDLSSLPENPKMGISAPLTAMSRAAFSGQD